MFIAYRVTPRGGRKILAEVCTYGLLPCLLGTKIAFAVSNGGGFGHWFMLPLYSAGHIGLGYALSRAYIAVSRRCGGVADDARWLPIHEVGLPPLAAWPGR